MYVKARVSGPHPGVRLAHRTEGVLHVVKPHRLTAAGGEGAALQALCKDLEQGDRVRCEGIGITSETSAEVEPQEAGGAGSGEALRRNLCTGCCLNSDPISEELVAGARVHIVQGEALG
jgi:hypothetical protein